MSAESNKALSRRWYEEVWNQGNAAVIAEILAEDAVVHGNGPDQRGPAEFEAFFAGYRAMFSNIHFEIEDLVAEGDTVATRWTCTAAHTGDGMGVQATGQTVNLTGMSFVKVEHGKVIEAWNNFDHLGLFQQMGVVNLP
ncbi:MAG TPA: ester cyclase [Vicinamibacterales bacterium]